MRIVSAYCALLPPALRHGLEGLSLVNALSVWAVLFVLHASFLSHHDYQTNYFIRGKRHHTMYPEISKPHRASMFPDHVTNSVIPGDHRIAEHLVPWKGSGSSPWTLASTPQCSAAVADALRLTSSDLTRPVVYRFDVLSEQFIALRSKRVVMFPGQSSSDYSAIIGELFETFLDLRAGRRGQ